VSDPRRSRDPEDAPPAWEPEPLQLPVDAPPPHGRSDEPQSDERGSHVLVIDLA